MNNIRIHLREVFEEATSNSRPKAKKFYFSRTFILCSLSARDKLCIRDEARVLWRVTVSSRP